MPRIENLVPLGERGPLRVMFLITSMPIGGAETLLVNLVQRMDSARFQPQIACMKEPGPLAQKVSKEMPVHAKLISHKFDVGVVRRMRRLFLDERIDAAVTVGAGDKMFWGRLAARRAKLPVVLSALHSTGWPDGIGRLNRLLTPITDGFIAVAKSHGQYLTDKENLPADKVFVIPNGVDTDHFVFRFEDRQRVRNELGIKADSPVISIVAALRPEKNHTLFLMAARCVIERNPNARLLIVGDGPERDSLETLTTELNIRPNVRFLGSRSDIAAVLSASDVFALTSRNEASPVSILESMSCSLPVVAPNVGSISELIVHGRTGFLYEGKDPTVIAGHWLNLIQDDELRRAIGENARAQVVRCGSLKTMTAGYESLLESIYTSKIQGFDQIAKMTLPTELSQSAMQTHSRQI